MVRKILTLMLISLSVPCFANFSESAPQGFHWYTSDTHVVIKEPQQEASITHTVTMAPHQQLKYLSLTTKDTLAVALLHPSVEHTAQYMRAQQWWAKRNQKFVRNWQQALIEYPDLDYSLRFPTDNTAIPVRNDEHKLLVERSIDTMSKHYGLIFFYRGNSSICQKFVSILAPFVKARHFAMISVTTDHQPIIGLPNPRDIPMTTVNRTLGIQSRYLPALFLVNLKTHQMKALSYAFLSLSDLKERFLDVRDHFAIYSYNGIGETVS